jgi:hypothetical protein
MEQKDINIQEMAQAAAKFWADFLRQHEPIKHQATVHAQDKPFDNTLNLMGNMLRALTRSRLIRRIPLKRCWRTISLPIVRRMNYGSMWIIIPVRYCKRPPPPLDSTLTFNSRLKPLCG